MRNGREPKMLQTLVGAVTEQRGGVRGVYPLNEALGLEPRERMTLGVRNAVSGRLWRPARRRQERFGRSWRG